MPTRATPNLELLEVVPTPAVDGAGLVTGKRTTLVAKVRNTTGRRQVVKARVNTSDDGGPESQVTHTVAVHPRARPPSWSPAARSHLRSDGVESFGWSVELDSAGQVNEADETDNEAHGIAEVRPPVPDLRVLFMPVRVGGSAHPTCGGTTAATNELGRVLDGRRFVDAVMPLNEHR